MSESLNVLVTGASGKQGGALARLLLQRGHHVRALTRSPESGAIQALRGLGAEVAVGGFDDPESLRRAAAGADTLFAMSTPYEAGPEAETRQGLAVVDAAKTAGVRHLVFNSVASADRATGIPHFESKHVVERHVRSLGVPYTIVAPVFFMENLNSPWWLPALQGGKLPMAMPATRALQQVAVADVANFSLMVIEERDRFLGRRVDIASDELTGGQVADILSRVTGVTIEYVELPLESLRAQNLDSALMFEWFVRTGYSADIAGLRRDYPRVGWHRFEQWAKAQDWSTLQRPVAR